MAIPKRVSIRLDQDEMTALIAAASEYVEQTAAHLGQSAVIALDAALGRGVSDFSRVPGLSLPPHLIDQAQTYFHLQRCLNQMQADFERAFGM
jgi:hypothetical protein